MIINNFYYLVIGTVLCVGEVKCVEVQWILYASYGCVRKHLIGERVIDGVAYACCSHNVFDPHASLVTASGQDLFQGTGNCHV